MEAYLRHLAAFRRPKTVDVYAYAARRLDTFLAGRPPDRQSLVAFAEHLATEEKLAPASVRLIVTGARTYLVWRRKQGEAVPEELDTPPSSRSRQHVVPVLRGEQFERYMVGCAALMPEPNRTLCRVLPLTGLRVSEACRLRGKDVQPTRDAWVFVITDSKGDDREVPLLPAGNAMFRAYLRDARPALPERSDLARPDQYVFPNKLGGPAHRPTVRKWLHLLRARLGLPKLSPHLLRHSYATMLEEAGVPTVTVMTILGHRSVTTTRHYSHGSMSALARRLASVQLPGAPL